MTDFWRGKRVLVTGGSGFIGSHLVRKLAGLGAEVTAAVYGMELAAGGVGMPAIPGVLFRSADLTHLEQCMELCRDQSAVFSIAHADGSLAFKKARPAYILRQNTLITLNMLDAAVARGVDRFLLASSAEVYPHDAVSPTVEDEAFRNMSDRLTDGYTWSKRISELAARIYVQEHGLKVAIARPNNVYGPKDYFDEARGRVIPMFIKRAVEGTEPILIWGTGETVRTFLYVDDLVRGLLDLLEKYPECDPVNLGGDEEITLRALAETVVRLSGRDVRIVCDTTKPSGAARRMSDISKARRVLGFQPTVSLEAGLKLTLDSYLSETQGGAAAAIRS
ncbi:MAG TPA: NAD-dependent epimerase/dehydratase family protein [Bryobacteraceae bacterium]|jgi:GDP-L-fucose synthase|nr:NAD-dependent epimerase/dehydratase family protein [Bryobacteraceae bacterium]